MSLSVDRQHQLQRLLHILNRLECGEALTRRLLAIDCNCSTRTIARDMAFLKEMGVEVTYDPRAACYQLTAPLPFQTLQFSMAEVFALAMAQQSSLAQSGSPLSHSLGAALARVAARLPQSLRPAIDAARKVVSFDTDLQRDYTHAPWQELTQAAQNRETVEICYHTLSRDSLSFRRVDSYLLAEREGYLMLIAYCHNRREVREFALDRIRQYQLTGETFAVESSFCGEEYLRGSVGALRGAQTEIEVRFDAAMAPYARRRQWRFPHEIEDLEDGSLLLRGVVSGEAGIRVELLSWGGGFEVLKPHSLRAAIQATGEAIARKHRSK